MKTLACAAAAALFLSAAAGAALWSHFRAREAADRAGDARAAEKLEREIAALRESDRALEARIAALEAARPAGAEGPPREASAPARIEEAVALKGAAHGKDGSAPSPGAADDAAAAETERLDRGLEALLDPGKSWDEKQRAWKELADAGLLDQALEALERRARENPGSADAQADAGVAYLQKLNTVTSDIEKGTWAVKADKAFDAALAIDDRHWEARFTKAMSLSFWPPVFGKQGEAIRQFEQLRSQQAEVAPEEKFAETYLLLGNMYRNQGEKAKAAEVWRDGAQRFPANKELTTRAAEAEEN
jgi:hypothetical protein